MNLFIFGRELDPLAYVQGLTSGYTRYPASWNPYYHAARDKPVETAEGVSRGSWKVAHIEGDAIRKGLIGSAGSVIYQTRIHLCLQAIEEDPILLEKVDLLTLSRIDQRLRRARSQQ
jgi:hypothetical protein